MANTTSLAWPNMFNVAQNRVAVLQDNVAIVNRTKLLLLSEPNELYNEPDFGTGLRKYLFQYNNENSIAMMRDNIKEQVRLHEPYVNADNTEFAEGLLYTESGNTTPEQEYNKVKMTVRLETTYADTVSLSLDENCKEVTL